jgi:hypothetical protein
MASKFWFWGGLKLITKPLLKNYHNVQHDFQVWEENGIFTLFIPEYGVFVKNVDLSEGYKELALEKEKYFQKLSDAGIPPEKLNDLSLSNNSFLLKKADVRLKSFFQLVFNSIVIMALVLGIGSVGVMVAGNVASKNMWRVFAKIDRYQPLEKLVAYVETLPEEKINEYRAQAHRLSIKLQPVIDEFKSALKNKPYDLLIKENRDLP